MAVRIDLPAGAATIIGSSPFTGAVESAHPALDSVPGLPSAPAVELGASGSSAMDADARDGLDRFLTRLAGRAGPIVMSVTGPVTLDLRLRRDGAEPEDAAPRAVAAVESAARWMLDRAARLLPRAPVLLFLQEPALAGSMHPTFPLGPAAIERLVREVVGALDPSATVGVQVEGRADWALLLRTGVGALAAPITAQLESAAAELAAFIERGGIVAWGAVPVDEPLGPSAERLWRRLSALWSELARLGTDPVLLLEHSIITPAGGLGAFGLSQAERVIALSNELGRRALHQLLGARMSLGA